ncbi:MAG: hypothetical protein K5639_04675 [Eubacterium sp.]|nr:hypothetical protein [Eubacterium sp.]
MRAETQYVIEGTAVKIVDTGRCIRVINVEQQKAKRYFFKTLMIIIISAFLTFSASLFLVDHTHTKVLLDKNIYTLKTEIKNLEHENTILQKNIEEKKPIDYNKILEKAHSMGMDFPTNDRVETYRYRKGSSIKVYE